MMNEVAFELLPVGALDRRRLDEIVSLLGRAFARWPPFEPGVPLVEHLRWKMTSPSAVHAAVLGRAAGGAAIGSTARGGSGPLVASLTVVTQRVLVRGREMPRLRFIDQAVDPTRRGEGLSAAMNAFLQDAVRHQRLRLTDRGSHPAMVRLREHQGALPFGNAVRTLWCPLRPATLARSALAGPAHRRALAPAIVALGAWTRQRRRREPAPSTVRVRTARLFGARCDALWTNAAREFDVAVVRDASHLAWRYADPRGGPSTILLAENDEELLGWAVLKATGPRGHLADLLVAPGRNDVVEALAREALERFDRSGASDVSCWLPGRHPYRRALRRAGFASWGKPVPLSYRWEGDGATDDGLLGRPETRIHFTLGDSDFV